MRERRRLCTRRKKQSKYEFVTHLSTARRHLQAVHSVCLLSVSNQKSTHQQQGEYYKWCKETGFVSMLPNDTQKRRKEAESVGMIPTQGSLDDHVQPMEKMKGYSDEEWKDAAIEWLISTDQVCLY